MTKRPFDIGFRGDRDRELTKEEGMLIGGRQWDDGRGEQLVRGLWRWRWRGFIDELRVEIIAPLVVAFRRAAVTPAKCPDCGGPPDVYLDAWYKTWAFRCGTWCVRVPFRVGPSITFGRAVEAWNRHAAKRR